MSETATFRAHRIGVVVLTLLYPPFYIVLYVVTAVVNLGGGGVSMDDILGASVVAVVSGAAGCGLGLALNRGHRARRAIQAWALWVIGASLSPVWALQLWEQEPRILWSPPIVVLGVGGVAWWLLREPDDAR